jgi:hypothetical protein
MDPLAITYFQQGIFPDLRICHHQYQLTLIGAVLQAIFLPDTAQWQAAQPSRNYGVAASQGRQIHCDFAFVSRRARY